MITWCLKLLLATVCVLLPALPLHAEEAGVPAIMLQYDEQEPGTDVYPLRMLVSDKYLRIDEGQDTGDFILMDRAGRRVYSIDHDEQTLLVLDYHAVEADLPEDLVLSAVQAPDLAAPKIQGRQAVNNRYLANDEPCLQTVTVPGLLDKAVTALAEYAGILAARELQILDKVPAAVQTPCYLARHVYAPAWHLQDGLPLQEWDAAGYRRSLVNFAASVEVPAALFRLPAGYEELRLN